MQYLLNTVTMKKEKTGESLQRNKIGIYCLILCMMLQCLFISCHKENLMKKELPFITKVDMEKMRQQQLPGYQLKSVSLSSAFGREYVYTKDQQNFNITIGLHPSLAEASSIADEYIKNASIAMKEGNSGLPVGDKYWHTNDESSTLTSIVFTRKNALVILSGPKDSQTDMEELVRNIDNDLQMNSSYVIRAEEMTSLNSCMINMNKSIYFEGDTAKITINVIDKNNEPLEYYVNGWSYYNAAKNEFTKIITRSYIDEPFPWERKIKWTVINKNNAIQTFNTSIRLSF